MNRVTYPSVLQVNQVLVGHPNASQSACAVMEQHCRNRSRIGRPFRIDPQSNRADQKATYIPEPPTPQSIGIHLVY